MTEHEQTVAAVNSLCSQGQFGQLHRLLAELPGSLAILLSDRPAEEKRRDLLKLLREGAK